MKMTKLRSLAKLPNGSHARLLLCRYKDGTRDKVLLTFLNEPLAVLFHELIRITDIVVRHHSMTVLTCARYALQQRMISEIHVDYFNRPDHDNTLTNVAAHKGVCLAPVFLNDHNGEFAWLDFDSDVVIPCGIYTHKNDKRPSLHAFIELLQHFYRDQQNFKV